MMLSEFEKAKIEHQLAAYCDQRVPAHVRQQVTMGFRVHGSVVTLFENRQFWRPGQWVESAIAQFRHRAGTGLWSLYWRDRNSKWHLYDRVPPARELRTLLQEVDRDPTGIFYG